MLITSLRVCSCLTPAEPYRALPNPTLPLLPYLQLYLGLSHTLWYTYTEALEDYFWTKLLNDIKIS